MAKRKAKTVKSAAQTSAKKRGPGRPPGSGTGKYKKSKGPGRPAKSSVKSTDVVKRGPGRPPGTGTGKYKKSKRGPGRPAKAFANADGAVKRGPGRPPGSGTGKYKKSKRGPGRPPLATRGPGRPPKSQSLEGVRITDRDLGKLLDLQSMILDIQRTHYKKSGRFDLSLTKQFSDNFKTVDRIVEILGKNNN